MTTTINPVSLGLSALQVKLYNLIADRNAAGILTTKADLAEAIFKEGSWIFRNLTVLIEKGVVERYNGKYYKLKGN